MYLFPPSSPAATEDAMAAPLAPNNSPDRDFDGGAPPAVAGCDQILPAEAGEDGLSFEQLYDDSNLSLPVALGSNTRVSAVGPGEWRVPQPNLLLPSAPLLVPSKIVGAGLFNLGNTCFLNAILQCFTHTVPLVLGLRSCTHCFPCLGHIDGFCVICGLRSLIENSLMLTPGQALSPKKIVLNLNYFSSEFTRYQQEDAHEFMQCALDKLERCFLELRRSDLNFEDDNLVQKVFGGRLISRLVCCSCGHTSDTYEPLIDMSLEIENVDSLSSALESFTKVEYIDNFKCDSCKQEVSMAKQLMLDQTPSVAAFHLKRFKTDGTFVEKIDKHIDFPLELDLLSYTTSNRNDDISLKYELYAVVVHIGFSSTSGHYFCFVRSAPDTWHKLDDSVVTEVSGDSVLSQEAYILFYAREGTPWMSSIMESQMQCLEQNIMNRSPTSVLDVSDSMCKSNPNIIPNIERGGADELKECSEPQFDFHTEEQDYLNDSCDANHLCGKVSIGTNQESIVSNGSEDVAAQVLFRNNFTLADSPKSDGISHIKSGGLDSNRNCQDVVDFREIDGSHSLTPPSSPSNDASDKFYISRDNLKMEKSQSCKRSSDKVVGDSERQFAVKYLNKTGSRREALKKFVLPSQTLDKKKRKKMDSSLCKKSNSLDVGRKSNHTSVSHPVAAGSSQ